MEKITKTTICMLRKKKKKEKEGDIRMSDKTVSAKVLKTVLVERKL